MRNDGAATDTCRRPRSDGCSAPAPGGRRSTSPTTRCRPAARRIWRFTPLKRLRGLHDGRGARPARVDGRARRAPDGVTVEAVGRDDEARRACAASRRRDRVGGPGLAAAAETALLVDVPPSTSASRADRRSRLHRRRRRGRRGGHLVDPRRRATPGHRRGRPHRHRRTLRRQRRVVVGDGAQLTVRLLQDWDDDAVHLGRSTRSGSAATRTLQHVAITFGGDLVRMHANVEYAGPGGEAEMLGLYFADEGQHIEHRLFVDHTAPHTKSHVRLQGRAAGRGRAHGLDRQRADPQGRRGHRDLRGEPQPGAHRRLPGRLGAEPRDRDRRDRGRRPRVGDRPLRRRAAVLPALARHLRGPRRAAWSCTASSTT